MYFYELCFEPHYLTVHQKKPLSILLLKSVNEFEFSSFNLSIPDFTKAGNVIQLGYPPLRVDLITEIDGVIFEECYKNKQEVFIDGLIVHFIGYNDLLKNKRASSRPRDIDDLENLK